MEIRIWKSGYMMADSKSQFNTGQFLRSFPVEILLHVNKYYGIYGEQELCQKCYKCVYRQTQLDFLLFQTSKFLLIFVDEN